MANDNSYFQAPDTHAPKTVSAHRAIVYAAGLPGWGEMYARAWWQGALTLLAFLGFLAWFCWLAWQSAQLLAQWTGGGLDFPVRELGLAFLGMLCAWFWGIFNAARTAQLARLQEGQTPQCSPAWAALMSWLCPGSGLGYAGRHLFGALFLGLHVCGLALMAPVFGEFGRGVGRLLSPENHSLIQNPIAVVGIVKELFFKLENSLPAVFLAATKMLAITLAVDLVARQRAEQESFIFLDPENKPRWYESKEVRAMGLFILGWFAPGAGQLLLGRAYGWYFLSGVAGLQLVVAVLLRHELIGIPLAGGLLWLPGLIRFAAMLEAPIQLLRNKTPGEPSAPEAG